MVASRHRFSIGKCKPGAVLNVIQRKTYFSTFLGGEAGVDWAKGAYLPAKR